MEEQGDEEGERNTPMADFGELFAELEELQELQAIVMEQLLEAQTDALGDIGPGTPRRLGPRTRAEPWRSRPGSGRSPTCEGKLYIGFDTEFDLGQVKKHGSSNSINCSVEVQGIKQNHVISIGEKNSPPELMFDIQEYFSQSRIECLFHVRRLFGRPKVVGADSMTLRDVISLQASLPCRSKSFDARALKITAKLYPGSDSTVYWGFERRISIIDPASGNPLNILMYGRYVRLRSCLERRVLGGIEQTELHFAVSRAPHYIVEDILAALSREGILSSCLTVKCKSLSVKSEGKVSDCCSDSTQPGATKVNKEDSIKYPEDSALTVETVVNCEPDTIILELTPLEAALQSGNSPAVKSLLQRAGNLCFENIPAGKCCNTPIHSAVRGGADAVRLVMRFLSLYTPRQSWGLSVNEMVEARDYQGRTPLMLASLLGRTLLVSQFLKMSCSPSVATGAQPNFKIISRYGKIEIASQTVTPSVYGQQNVSGSRGAIGHSEGNGGVSLLSRLMTFDRSSRPEDTVGLSDSWTALMYASSCGHLDIVKLLLSTSTPSLSNESQLSNRSAVASMQCAPCARNREGLTALMLAATYGHLRVVEELILAGIPLQSQNSTDGNTVLHIAALKGRMEICMLLLSAESAMWGVHWGDDKLWNKFRKQFESILGKDEVKDITSADQSIGSPRSRKKNSKDITANILQHMKPKFKLLNAVNFRGMSADAMALKCGFPEIAELLTDARDKIYKVTLSNKQIGSSEALSTISDSLSQSRINGCSIIEPPGGELAALDNILVELTPESISEIDDSEHAAYIFALAAAPQKGNASSGPRGFTHMDLHDPDTTRSSSPLLSDHVVVE